jgi:ribonucleotide reductase beta subunit family protein with ferritin-like domain
MNCVCDWLGQRFHAPRLGADLKDWASNRITTNERALLTQIFRFFTQSDIKVGDNYLKRFIPIFQPLPVQMMMASFAMFLNFPRHNKMNGMGQIISWSVRDEKLALRGGHQVVSRVASRDRGSHARRSRRYHRHSADHGEA